MVQSLTLQLCFEFESRLFCDFPQSPQDKCKIIPQNNSRLMLPSTYFKIHHSNHSNIIRQQTTQSTNNYHSKQQNKISLKHEKSLLQVRQSVYGFLVWRSQLNLKFFHIIILMNKAAIKQVSLFSFLLPDPSTTTPHSVNTTSEIHGGSNQPAYSHTVSLVFHI